MSLLFTGLSYFESRHESVETALPSPLRLRRPETENYCGPARDFSELCRAYALVQKRYIDRGYAQDNNSGMRYSVWNLIPNSTTFVIAHDTHILGTLTIVIDSRCGLPASKEFDEEFETLRRQSRFVAEATMFACEGDGSAAMSVSLKLMALAARWCIEAGIDDLCLVVTKTHARFYEKALGCERLGGSKSVGHVQGTEGVFLRCDVSGALENKTGLTSRAETLLGAALENGKLSFNRSGLNEVETSLLLDADPGIYFDATPEQREAIERHYPLACISLRASYPLGDVTSLVEEDAEELFSL